MFNFNRAIFAGAFAFGLAASPAAFAEDKNATQTNSGPARDSGKNSSHDGVPAPKEAGSDGHAHGDKQSADQSKGPATTAAPTQTSGHDQSR